MVLVNPAGLSTEFTTRGLGGLLFNQEGFSNRLTPGPDWLDISPTHKRGRDMGRPRWRFGLVSDSQASFVALLAGVRMAD